MWESMESRLALLELLTLGKLKQRRTQRDAYERLAELPWTRNTGRRHELSLVETRRTSLVELLGRVWPTWRDQHLDLLEAGLLPTPEGWRQLSDLQRAGELPHLPERLNRRTAAALAGPHAKSVLTSQRLNALGDTEIVDDGVVRLRPPPGMTALRNGRSVPLDDIVGLFDEVGISDRALRGGLILQGRIRGILLIENLGAWRDIRHPKGWMLVYVPGWNTSTVRQLLAVLDAVPTVHFGDLDPNGVRIHHHLRESVPDLGWLVPEFWGEYTVKHGQKKSWPAELDLTGAPALVQELAAAGTWLEQEHIVLDPRLMDAVLAGGW